MTDEQKEDTNTHNLLGVFSNDWCGRLHDSSSNFNLKGKHMKKTLKKIGLSTALATLLLVNVPTKTFAIFGAGDFVFDIPHTAGTIAGWVAEAENWVETVQHYKNQADTYKNMLKNIGRLPPEQWAEFSASFLNIKNSLAYQEGLSSAAADFDSKFNKYFPGFDKYLTAAKSGNLDFQGIYKKLNQIAPYYYYKFHIFLFLFYLLIFLFYLL